MPISRRQFLIAGSILGVVSPSQAFSAAANSISQPTDIILGGGSYAYSDSDKSPRFFLSINHLYAPQPKLIDTHFLPHGVHQHPQDQFRMALFEKKGPGACEVDLASGKVIRKIHTQDTKQFYGHGAYSPDGKHLYCTESYKDTDDGIVAVRDTESMKLIHEIPSYGQQPHECRLVGNGDVMVVTNSGGKLGGQAPNISFIDIKTNKLLDQKPLTDENINAGHIDLDNKGNIVVVSAPRRGLAETDTGGVSIQLPNDKLITVNAPKKIRERMIGEALSVIIHPQKPIAVVTHPSGDLVTFWSMDDRQLLRALAVPNPRGVTLSQDNRRFLLSFDHTADLIAVDVATLVPDPQSRLNGTFLTGSHIYNFGDSLQSLFS